MAWKVTTNVEVPNRRDSSRLYLVTSQAAPMTLREGAPSTRLKVGGGQCLAWFPLFPQFKIWGVPGARAQLLEQTPAAVVVFDDVPFQYERRLSSHPSSDLQGKTRLKSDER
jgi:hypothetical protein